MIYVRDTKTDYDRYPIGYLTIINNKYHFESLTHIRDAQGNSQTRLNKDIKKIYDIDFPCTIFYIDNTKNEVGIKGYQENNILIIPRNNTANLNENTISSYIRMRLKGKPSIKVIDETFIYKIVNSNLVKIKVKDAIENIAKLKGIKLKEPDPRTMVYPVYRYKNYSRRSGVYAYAYSNDKTIIYVYFIGERRAWYKYDIKSASRPLIEEMIRRAKKGWGLNRFINKHPKTYYWKGKY